MWVRSLGWEDLLEEEMATYSCLENPLDRGAWQATVYWVAKSQTQLKWQHKCTHGFSSNHVRMWEMDHKGWGPKNRCFLIVVLEKTLKSPLASKEIKPDNPKGNQPWISIGRTDAEAEAPVLWPPDAKSWLIGKDPDAGKDWKQKEKRVSADEMLDSITDSMDINLSKFLKMVVDKEG